MRTMIPRTLHFLTILVLPAIASAGEIHVGAATTSITPDEPVAVSGQFATRIATEVESPCTATAIALESREGETVRDQAIMIACELVAIRDDIQQRLREKLKGRLAGFDPTKLFLSATHTHTAPVMREDVYDIPKDGVMQPAEYVSFLIDRLADVAAQAWNTRKPGAVSWGMGHAVVAQNRRIVYADGSARMYGPTSTSTFRAIEGYEDHGVEVLFFYQGKDTLIATAVNVACPAQEVESRRAVNADFWHHVREQLREKYGDDLNVAGWIGAAGDQSPHLMLRKKAEERMRRGRKLTRLEEIARRIVRAVDEAYEVAKDDLQTDPKLVHHVANIQLPSRVVTPAEYAENKAQVAELEARKKKGRDTGRRRLFFQKVVDRYEQQEPGDIYEMELHAIRLGDVAICTNPFELFTDYGIQMKGRSKALQTFVIQLAGTSAAYLATHKAVRGGSYSATVASNLVGPEGGQVLVDETVKAINALWPTPGKTK